MNRIRFYTDKDDNSEIRDYITQLAISSSKDSRIKLNKIRDYVNYPSLPVMGFLAE